jgi:AcrR family transcriptional regulator
LSKAAVKAIEPRKTPVQARSTASVEAILQATIQVLLKEGKLKLTTTRVAHRAGVSVGTLYQYFPNKSALLQALLKAHLDGVALAVEQACEAAHGATLEKICEFICAAFLQAKFRNLDAGAALYGVSRMLWPLLCWARWQVRAAPSWKKKRRGLQLPHYRMN